jgi:predicted TIM-barrel fold metal-dependent hydrolase
MPNNLARRGFLAALAGMPLAVSSTVPSLRAARQVAPFRRIDIHTHISTDAPYLREVMDALNMKMFTICNEGLKVDRLVAQIRSAAEIVSARPRYYAWATTFGFDRMEEPGWAARVNASLKRDFDNGALGVKVWKEIGMQLKDRNGRFVQIDDAVFGPVLEFIRREGKTLLAHIGDPVQRWMPLSADGRNNSWYTEGATEVQNRVGSFRGEVPYEDLIRARDRVLARHPDLRVIGCHLGSMEFDVDEVARRLDRFPNFAVETSAAMNFLMAQSREKVRSFFIRYQDRLIYGADISGGLIATRYLIDMSKINDRWTPQQLEAEKTTLMRRYENDFAYYATSQEFPRRDFTVRGLELPEEVLRKLFYANAVRWVPGIDRDFN